MEKQVVIIGAGIAGLTAGVYALESGYKTLILEQHSIAGGICTSWKRKGYLFEGSIHWQIGTGEKEPLNEVWRETGAINDDTKILLHDPFLVYEDGKEKVCLYRDLEKFKKHLMEISPEDKRYIKKLCKDIKAFIRFNFGIKDIKNLKVKYPVKHSLKDKLKLLPIIVRMPRLARLTTIQYAQNFKHEGIQKMLCSLLTEDYSSIGLVYTLAVLMRNDGGYPEGGSLPMVQRMVKRYKELGGEIRYNSKVEQVLVDNNGTTTGVKVNEEVIPADSVIVACDTVSAVRKFFDKPLQDEWIKRLNKNTVPLMCTFICIGTSADLSNYDTNIFFKCDEPFMCADKLVTYFGVNNYATFKGMAPEKSSALTVYLLDSNCYEWWKEKKEDGTYEAEKEKVAENVIKNIQKVIPEIEGKIEVIDVATPLTYERYCDTWQGSWMSMIPTNIVPENYPVKCSDLSNVYFAGERMMIAGGLPVALASGRNAVQWMCRDDNVEFQGCK